MPGWSVSLAAYWRRRGSAWVDGVIQGVGCGGGGQASLRVPFAEDYLPRGAVGFSCQVRGWTRCRLSFSGLLAGDSSLRRRWQFLLLLGGWGSFRPDPGMDNGSVFPGVMNS